jgi:membrane dipeptidase
MQTSVPPAPLAGLIDHIDRMVELAGIDHVGVGTDYTLGSIPSELDPADRLPNLTHALLARGYSEEDVRKIWAGNFMRVFG